MCPDPPTDTKRECRGLHTIFSEFTEPRTEDHVLNGAVKLLEIVPLTPRFISVGLVMFVDNAAPLLITLIFFVVPAAVAALA